MRLLAPLLLALGAVGCNNSAVRIEPHALSDQATRSPEHFIIAAVDNEPTALAMRAGSSPRGYDGIVAYGASVSARQTMRSLENDYGLTEVSAWPIEPLHMHCAVLEVPHGTDRATVLAALALDRRIKLAEPLQSFATRTQDYNDPYVDLQRGFREMDVAQAHPWSRGDGVKIAIIDTGADTGHPDLRGNIASAANFVDADEKQFQLDRHGTEVAGVIAAVANNRTGIVGVAPGARLLLFKACWQARNDADAARCNSFTLARALVAAYDAHAQVINLSLAGPEDPLLSGLIREGVRRGVLFVGAAGVDGAMGFMDQPGVIEVASAGTQAVRGQTLFAPGREILTLMPGGHYDFASGDSIATAEVTGVVALLLARDSNLSAAAAYRVLRDTSGLPGGAASEAKLVDACAAVTSVVGRGSCGPAASTAGSTPAGSMAAGSMAAGSMAAGSMATGSTAAGSPAPMRADSGVARP